MPQIININSSEDLIKFTSQYNMSYNNDIALKNTVTQIINDVKNLGDEALFSYGKKFDNIALSPDNIAFTKAEIDAAYNNIAKDLKEALTLAHKRVFDFHKRQYPADQEFCDAQGVVTGWKWYPLESVGLYVPGGLASYPSSVIMTGTIAQVAGVKEVVMTMPCPNNQYNPAALAAAKMIGVDKIYKIGGAGAVAAMAYGTDIIPKVCKIVGPGNAYVAEAKKQVFGDVGIDSVAGPSEILILSDKNANPKWLAYDLLSQAEHDPNARSILVTDSKELAQKVVQYVEQIIPKLKRKDITKQSWQDNGKIIIVADLENQGVQLVNQIAPEHLELMVADHDKFIAKIYNAGAIFIGKYTTEAIGDYMAGPSHVLPTAGAARFSSALSIYDFMRKSSLIHCDKAAFKNIADKTILLAESEGLECHAQAVKIRQD